MNKLELIKAVTTLYKECSDEGNCWHCPFCNYAKKDDITSSCALELAGRPHQWKYIVHGALNSLLYEKQQELKDINSRVDFKHKG